MKHVAVALVVLSTGSGLAFAQAPPAPPPPATSPSLSSPNLLPDSRPGMPSAPVPSMPASAPTRNPSPAPIVLTPQPPPFRGWTTDGDLARCGLLARNYFEYEPAIRALRREELLACIEKHR